MGNPFEKGKNAFYRPFVPSSVPSGRGKCYSAGAFTAREKASTFWGVGKKIFFPNLLRRGASWRFGGNKKAPHPVCAGYGTRSLYSEGIFASEGGGAVPGKLVYAHREGCLLSNPSLGDAFYLTPAISRRRAMRSLMSGWVLNSLAMPPPKRGATMNISAVVGLPFCMGMR